MIRSIRAFGGALLVLGIEFIYSGAILDDEVYDEFGFDLDLAWPDDGGKFGGNEDIYFGGIYDDDGDVWLDFFDFFDFGIIIGVWDFFEPLLCVL